MHENNHSKHQIGFTLRVRRVFYVFFFINFFSSHFFCIYFSWNFIPWTKCHSNSFTTSFKIPFGQFKATLNPVVWRENEFNIWIKSQSSEWKKRERLPRAMFRSNISWSSRRFRTAPFHLHQKKSEIIHFLSFRTHILTDGSACFRCNIKGRQHTWGHQMLNGGMMDRSIWIYLLRKMKNILSCRTTLMCVDLPFRHDPGDNWYST